ncbi:S8 family serine peptidase [Flavobacteriaceae bacterium KMM 6898]|nr:S8 family serine peptidase [Flavobacteriaceae bacterium KMM 6898]
MIGSMFSSRFYFFFILFSILVISSCIPSKQILQPNIFSSVSVLQQKNSNLSNEELKTWHTKDVFIDTLPGISLDKAYDFVGKKRADTVIVAILDMTVDIEHEDLLYSIWKNIGEIPNNGLDDDSNGYVDDINGWNFIGWTNNESSQFVNYEYTRILRKYHSRFKGKEKNEINDSLSWEYDQYIRAQEAFNERMSFAKDEKNNALALTKLNKANKELLSKYIPETNFTLENLSNLSSDYKSNSELQEAIEFRKELIQYGILDSIIIEDQLKADERIDKLLNLKYNDREPIGDKFPENVKYKGYGNSNINYNTSLLNHGTLVAGVLAANRENGIGAMGITNAVKIMPLSISAYGDEHDKDMALAIRYAVDNGARIINISSGKSFSMNQEWVHEAILYASKKNVLIITSASNDGMNLDDNGVYNYPNDTDKMGNEIGNNFIKVGSITHKVGKDLFDVYSNYGKREVDIFAPGEEIYTTSPYKDKYTFESGTSFAAPIVTGVAALIISYYPHLTAEEVKNIILESGIEYTIDVNISKDEEQPKLVPFVTLSKSGKVVNAYYALKLAGLYRPK